jgi:O-antigen/teichoic acid export membrane protein
MLNFIKTSLAGLVLRSLSSLSKFLIVVYIAKYFSTDDLGIFGLFNSTIILSIYLLGFEFYNFNTREILSVAPGKFATLIRDQFIAYTFAYGIVLPSLLLVFFKDFLPFEYLVWFYFILITDHLSVEFYRIFTVLSRPVFANVIFFIKTGLWSLGLIALWMAGMESTKTLSLVWMAWFGGSFLACLLSIWYLYHLKIHLFTLEPVDWSWIKRGYKVSLPFFIIAISLRLIEQSGRFFIDSWYSKSEVGIYSFFWNIANLENIIIFTGIIMILYPKLVETFKKNQMAEFNKILRQFKRLTYFSSLVLAGALILGIGPLLGFLGKTEFYAHLPVYYILILANTILNISYVPHYILYAKDADRLIVWSTLTGSLLNITGNILVIPRYGLIGASLSILVSYLVIWALKEYYVQKQKPGTT